MAYTELHCHSAFSFLDGASLPDEIVAAAVELGYDALALTDHNSVSGSMEFAMAEPTRCPDRGRMYAGIAIDNKKCQGNAQS